MQVTSKTLYRDFEVYEQAITQDSMQDLKMAAERKFRNCYSLTIDEFFGIVNGDYSLLGDDLSNPTVLQVYWLKRFKDFTEELAHICERLSIKDPAHEHLHNGCVKIEPIESVLIFTREYFGLPSFMAAGERTIGEYITARKDKYNEARMQRNADEEARRKFKLKK